MYQTVLEALQQLADSGVNFGVENSRKGEREFQNALGGKLQELTRMDEWSWRYHARKEERFKTQALTNTSSIAVDLVGRHQECGAVAIELKYVAIKPNGVAPQDAYAFPWDVAKDCLKLDLLRAGRCEPAKGGSALPDPSKLQTYCIGMTSWPVFWEGREKFAWATNFLAQIQPSVARFEGLIHTIGPSEKTVSYHKRHHISFGRVWTGEWRDYTKGFRYIFLRPETNSVPAWTHHKDRSIDEQSQIIPFLNVGARQEWERRYSLEKANAGIAERERSSSSEHPQSGAV